MRSFDDLLMEKFAEIEANAAAGPIDFINISKTINRTMPAARNAVAAAPKIPAPTTKSIADPAGSVKQYMKKQQPGQPVPNGQSSQTASGAVEGSQLPYRPGYNAERTKLNGGWFQ